MPEQQEDLTGSGTTPDVPAPVSSRRLRALASSAVVDDRGRRVGRVHDVFLEDRTGVLAAISVAMGRFLVREVLVPADLVDEVGPNRVRVSVPGSLLREGRPTPAVGHVGPSELDAARRALCGRGAP